MYFIVVWWYVGVDRLDKELTIAQMQGEHVYVVSTLMMFVCVGKFQMTVLSGCGHTVHEDTPDKVHCVYIMPVIASHGPINNAAGGTVCVHV